MATRVGLSRDTVSVSRRLETGFFMSRSRSRSRTPLSRSRSRGHFLTFWKLSRSESLVFLETVSKRKSCSLVEVVSKVLVQTVFCSELCTVLHCKIVLCRMDNYIVNRKCQTDRKFKKAVFLVLRFKSIEKISLKFALSVQNFQIS